MNQNVSTHAWLGWDGGYAVCYDVIVALGPQC